MKFRNLPPLLCIALLGLPTMTLADEEAHLVEHMKNLQYFMHKTALSLDAGNLDLVQFYAHEIEETIEAVEEVKEYDDFKIGKMTKNTLAPEFEKFEDFVDSKDMKKANVQFNKMVESCNQCHASVNKGYIKIERMTVNPFMQSFKP